MKIYIERDVEKRGVDNNVDARLKEFSGLQNE